MSRPVPPDVVAAAQAAQRHTGVPASVSIAQWALESGWGAALTGDFNGFGIKARPGEPFKNCWTHEVVHGQRIKVIDAFRSFASQTDAFERHAELIANAPIYADAMRCLPVEDAFIGAMAHHYATDPAYAGKLLELIKDGDFRRYDT